MSEYMGGSGIPDASQPPTAGTGAGRAEKPAQRVTTAPRRLLGPFTVRQVGLANAIVLGLALVLFVATRPLGSATPTAIQPDATFYRIAAETEGLQIGQRAPDLAGTSNGQAVRLTDLEGKEIRLADFKGRPVWVVFWATWCPPCQQETPDIRAAYEAHRDKGLVVLAVDVQEPADVVRDYARRYELSYTIGLDTSAATMKTYGVFGLPTHYFIDRGGVIRDRFYGPLKRDQMDQRISLISQP